jgi:DNA-binding transcriptional LysR family regulator
MVAMQIGEISRAIIASPELFKDYPVPQRPEELATLPWVSLTTFYHSQIELKNRASGELVSIKFNPRLRTDNLYAMKNAVVKGVGVGVSSTWIVLEDMGSGKLINVLPEWSASRLPVYLIYPYARFYPAKLRCFVSSMKQMLPKIFDPISDS